MGKLEKATDNEPPKDTLITEEEKQGAIEGKRAALQRLFRSKQFKIGAPATLIVVLAVCVFVEPVKFALLNVVTSSQVKFVVVDDSTLAPVNDAKITIGGKAFKTDKNGKVTAKEIDFGKTTYTIEKETYTTKKADTTVKTGTNLVGPLKVHSNGVPVEVHAINKLSGEAVTDFVVAIDGTKISARSDKKGLAVLKVPSNKLGKQNISITASGYNSGKQEISVAVGRKDRTAVSITPTGKHYFLSNRDGKVSVYSSNLDGTDQALIVAGSASDNQDTTLTVSPNNKYAALVSRRDNMKDARGNIMQAIYSVDLEAKTIKRVDEGARYFRFVGWASDTHMVYTVNYDEWNRQDGSKLKSADVTNGKLTTHITARDFRSALLYENDRKHTYVALTDMSSADYGLYSVDILNKSKQKLHPNPVYVYGQIKPGYITFRDDTDSKWYELTLKTQKVAAGTPTDTDDSSVSYIPSEDGNSLATVDHRDGKGVIITTDPNGNNEKVIGKGINAGRATRWVANRYIVYSVFANQRADYIIDTKTGTATKISDTHAGYYY